jgi:hypothetical protein
MSNEEELAALKARVAELEAKAKPPEPIDWERVVAEHRDKMHQAAERRANNWWIPDRDDLQKMKAAVTPADCADLARHGTIPTRSVDGVSGTISSVHPNPGMPGSHRGTGWVESKPLGPVPGLQHVDNIAAGFAARDRAEAIEQEARRLAAKKLAESK